MDHKILNRILFFSGYTRRQIRTLQNDCKIAGQSYSDIVFRYVRTSFKTCLFYFTIFIIVLALSIAWGGNANVLIAIGVGSVLLGLSLTTYEGRQTVKMAYCYIRYLHYLKSMKN
ncbi:hypothetical protein OO7_10527 [Providencia sneebia DSM 19967]|uniref:Uncharacterized protein n=1 Tax=Providencia sneebia DSM 19967 TaxID=1141660 RepID=K8WFY7_9GAMM|nr:hypothetical protein OO7_10527 [Providencia sneebia DSM 19967]